MRSPPLELPGERRRGVLAGDHRQDLALGEIFYTLGKAQIMIESWRHHYNTVRAHASFGYRPLVPEVFLPAVVAWPTAQPQPAPPATLDLEIKPAIN